MQPYRAIWKPATAIEEPVIVVEALVLPDEYVLLAVSQLDGRHVVDQPDQFRCTEPSYLGQPDPSEPDHEHEFESVAEPVLDGGRVVAMVRHCKHPGCAEVLRIGKGAAEGVAR